jgi:hypothetical protein
VGLSPDNRVVQPAETFAALDQASVSSRDLEAMEKPLFSFSHGFYVYLFINKVWILSFSYPRDSKNIRFNF